MHVYVTTIIGPHFFNLKTPENWIYQSKHHINKHLMVYFAVLVSKRKLSCSSFSIYKSNNKLSERS